MPGPNRTHVTDLRGAAALMVDATSGVTRVVERMHRTIQRVPGPAGAKTTDRPGGITGLVYRSVMAGIRLSGLGIDAGLQQVAEWLPESETGSSQKRDALLSALNGVYGDFLADRNNPLAIDMTVRHAGTPIDLENPPASTVRGPAAASAAGQPGVSSGRLLLLVHGLCLNDDHWLRDGHDHGAELAEEFGYVPLYLRYNTGRRIADNGRELAVGLETLVSRWPAPVTELVIIGHSMGGLVARSACHFADLEKQTWRQHLRKLIFLGSPHYGAPLERGGHRLDRLLEISPYSAPLAQIGRRRSAGITDLRHGRITHGAPRIEPLPENVKCYAAAATLGAQRGLLSERLVGDGLVPIRSALGHHPDAGPTLGIPEQRQWVGYRMGHLELLGHPEVHSRLRCWIARD